MTLNSPSCVADLLYLMWCCFFSLVRLSPDRSAPRLFVSSQNSKDPWSWLKSWSGVLSGKISHPDKICSIHTDFLLGTQITGKRKRWFCPFPSAAETVRKRLVTTSQMWPNLRINPREKKEELSNAHDFEELNLCHLVFEEILYCLCSAGSQITTKLETKKTYFIGSFQTTLFSLVSRCKYIHIWITLVANLIDSCDQLHGGGGRQMHMKHFMKNFYMKEIAYIMCVNKSILKILSIVYRRCNSQKLPVHIKNIGQDKLTTNPNTY